MIKAYAVGGIVALCVCLAPGLAIAFEGKITASKQSASEQPAQPQEQLRAPARQPRQTTGQLHPVVRVALGEIGMENRRGNDKVKYNNYNGSQWCAYFVTWVYRKAGYKIPLMSSSRGTLDWFKRNNHTTFTDPSQAAPGDIVVWRRSKDYFGHIGIVVVNDAADKTILFINGNDRNDRVSLATMSYDTIKSHLSGLVGFGRWK